MTDRVRNSFAFEEDAGHMSTFLFHFAAYFSIGLAALLAVLLTGAELPRIGVIQPELIAVCLLAAAVALGLGLSSWGQVAAATVLATGLTAIFAFGLMLLFPPDATFSTREYTDPIAILFLANAVTLSICLLAKSTYQKGAK